MTNLILPLLMKKVEKKKEKYVVPSWNHLYKIINNRPILDKYALEHKKIIQELTKKWMTNNNWSMTVDQKVIIEVWIYWNDARKKDAHNLDKIILDAMEGYIYDDDCNVLLRYMDFDIDVENPRIEMSFTKGNLFNRKERKKEKEREKNE